MLDKRLPDRTVGRLSLYRRLLSELRKRGVSHVYSHELAKAAGVTAAQVRRDVMATGYSGSPTRGYEVEELAASIGKVLDGPARQNVALVGVGNLGRAMLAYFSGRRPNLSIVAAFDSDPGRVNRVINGVRCYPMGELSRVVAEEGITVGVIAVPTTAAQEVAAALIRAGVTGLLNFAPTPLHTPPHVYVQDMDVTTSLERVAYFARQSSEKNTGA